MSDTYVVVVRPTGGGPGWDSTPIEVGDAVELYWVGGQEERTLGGTVTQLEAGEDARWHLAVKGQAQRSQRRKAVRARVEVPVIIPWAGGQMTGSTVDLSEGGMRALMDGWGTPARARDADPAEPRPRRRAPPPARRVRVDVDPRCPVAPGHEVRGGAGEGRRRAPPAGVPGPPRRAGGSGRLTHFSGGVTPGPRPVSSCRRRPHAGGDMASTTGFPATEITGVYGALVKRCQPQDARRGARAGSG